MPKKPYETKYGVSAEFQKRIMDATEEQELTKVQFAKAAGVSKDIIIKATAYQIVPSTKSIIKIANYMQVPVMYLFGETDDDYFSPARNPSTFFERLAQLTEEKRVKYSALSHTLSFAPNAVYEWIRTNSLPSLDYLVELAQYFDVSVDYLLGRTDDRN